MAFEFHIPTEILFGRGQLSNLHLKELPGKKALIITTRGKSVKKYGYLDRVINELALANVGYALYDEVMPNPTKENVEAAASKAKAEGCDFVLGLGGGSAIDCAKATAIMMRNPGNLWDYFFGGSAKGKALENPPAPIVAVTTTAGTGTEADPWLVVTKSETDEKIGAGYPPGTFPVLSIVDPELMLSVPPDLTAYQGFDAFFHSAEGYINTDSNPVGDALAVKAIEYIGKYLARAVKNGNDIEAREGVALANTLSGMVESVSPCTSEHSLEHALSAYNPTLPHGKGLIIISEAYYSYFVDKNCCDEKLINMAKALGNTDAHKPTDFIDTLVALQKDCNVYGMKLSEYGIKKDEFSKYVENAIDTCGEFQYDPYPLTKEAAVKIFEDSYR